MLTLPESASAWQQVTNGLPNGATMTRIVSDGGNVMALYVSSPAGSRGVYFSTNSGFDWFKGSATLPGSNPSSAGLLVVGNTVYLARTSQAIGTNALLYTADFGTTWSGGGGIPNNAGLDLLATDGAALFTALQNGNDVYRSVDGGANWTLAGSRNVNFNNGTVRTLGGKGGRAVATTGSGHYLLSDATTNWLRTTTLGNHAQGSRLAWQGGNLLSLYGDANRRILGLPDGTTNWFDATNGLVEGYLNFGAFVDLAASTGAVFAANWTYNTSFATVPGLYQSTNGGTNWTSLPASQLGNVAPTQLAVSSGGLFVLIGNKVFRVGLVNGLPLFAPQINTQPTGFAVHPGTNLTLTATVTGEGPLSLQWLKNGAELTGETNTTLNLANVNTNDSGSYVLRATNPGGTTFSDAAVVQVIPRLPGRPNLDFQPGWFASDAGGVLFNGTVYTVAALTNGQILVGGQFSHANTTPTGSGTYTGGVPAQAIARLNPDGSADASFQSAAGVTNGSIQAIVVAADGKILIGGRFANYAGVTRTNIARLLPNGTIDPDFATNAINNDVQGIIPQSDGRIIIRGSFSSINGVSRFGLARLNADGSFDSTWPAGAGPNSSPNDIAAAGDDVLVAGCFSQFNSVAARKYLALADTNGIASTNLTVGFNNCPNSVAVQPGGLFWVAGFFTQYSNAPIPSLVRVATDGSLTSVSPTSLSNPGELFSQANGSVIVPYLDSTTGYRLLMRFNADGSIDESFNTGPGFSSLVQAMAMPPSGDLYVAGFFGEFHGVPMGGLARLYAAPTNVTPQIPVITLSPKPTAALAGANVLLRAAAFGAAPLHFFWLKNGAIVSGETNLSLTIFSLSPLNTGDYQFVASNSSGSVTSTVAQVTLASAPAITQQPPAFTGNTNGGNVWLSFAAAGTAPLSVQWYRNGGAVFGATNNPHVISNLSGATTGNWTAIVTNLYGRATTDVSSVQIGTLPNIIGKANNQTVNGEGNVNLFVTASGSTPFTYLWYQNGALVEVRTNNTWTLSNAVPPQAGSYFCVVSNFIGSVTSAPITVTIRNPFLSQSPANTTVELGGSTNFSALALGSSPLNYYWYRRGFSTQAGMTNFLGTGGTLPIGPVTKLDSQYQYYVIASNHWGAVTSSLRSLFVNYAPAITNLPDTNIVKEVNEYWYFEARIEGQPYPDIRWYKDGSLLPTFTSTAINIPSLQTNDSGTYQLVISNYLGSATSAPIVLAVKPPRPPTVTSQPPNRLAKIGDYLNLPVTADGSPFLYYAWFKQDGAQLTTYSQNSTYAPFVSNTNLTGGYYCIVTNAYGGATSDVAQVTVIAPQPATYADKQFVKIADSLTTIPGLSPLRFAGFRDAFLRGGQVWFGGVIQAVPFSVGVYHWQNGSLTSLVNTNDSVPGTGAKFTNYYGSTFLSDGKVIFGANGSGGQHGLYAWTNGSVIKLYDTSTVMPGRSDTFERFGWPAVVGNQFAFLGFQSYGNTNFFDDYRAVYVSSNGVLTKLADTNTVLPNLGGNFVGSSSQVGFDGNTVAWWALNETNGGIFTVGRTQAIASRADEFTVNPGTGLNFDGFISPPSVQSGRVYLVGHDGSFNTTLLYRDPAGPLTVIAKPGDAIPSRGIAFDSVGYPFQAGSSAGVFYDGSDGGGYSGIFFWNGTNSVKVIDSFDTLDGSAIQYIYVMDAEADCLLFNVIFTNGRNALYATLPTGPTFAEWAANYTFPPGLSDPEDDADNDRLRNVFEFYFGSNPILGTSGALPIGLTVNVSGTIYPAISFVRSKNVSGITLVPRASSSVLFGDSLGVTIHSVVDLGGGLEQVTIRSAVSSSALPAQFLRIQLTIP